MLAMAMSMSTSSSSRLPLCSSSSRSIPSEKKKRKKNDGGDRGAMGEFLRITRRDGDFINEKLRFFGKKTRPLRDRISRTVNDLFWLRHLEDQNMVDEPRGSSALPVISYPPGLPPDPEGI